MAKEQPDLHVYEVDTASLVPYANNAKIHTSTQVDQICKSIEEFGFNDPIAVWENADGEKEIVEGHGRVLAAEKLGLDVVPVIYLNHLSDAQRRAYTHVHNQLNMNTGWDFDILEEDLQTLDFDFDDFGFDIEEEFDLEEPKYTAKANAPVYEPTGLDVDLSELCDMERYDALIKEIKKADVSEDERSFLEMAASRHVVFHYANIADYYANASEEMQRLMEESALVIIDFDDAISKGFVRLTGRLAQQIEDCENEA